MRKLYNKIDPYERGYLDVGYGHVIYYEVCGNPDGKPVVILHAGPGAGIDSMLRRFHNHEIYKIILFDQRGCGRSKPFGSIEHNTTWDLVLDMEKLRRHLNIDNWQIYGGSWGAGLGLAYTEKYKDNVTELVLRSIFTLRKSELDWFYQNGASHVMPDLFEKLQEPIPERKRSNMIKAYYDILMGSDEQKMREAALAWSKWEGAALSLVASERKIAHKSNVNYAIALARIECHYFVHGGFFDYDGQAIVNSKRLVGIPAIIIQDRYDIVTPAITSYEVYKAFPDAELKIIDDNSKIKGEDGVIDAIVGATDKFALA